MFSALKKLTTKSGPDGGGTIGVGVPSQSGSLPIPQAAAGISPGGMQTMDASLQKKFARGVHYNMKLIIKGDRNTGKTCLFQRLQGKPFNEEYVPTDEIQVASIQWNYKAADDIVKVEVWDIVDKGKKRKQLDGLKLGNPTSKTNKHNSMDSAAMDIALDAEFVDVYKGTHGVVFMFDVTKLWTFEYIQREIPKVPIHIPILIMANFIDMGHHRVVTRDQTVGFIEHFDRMNETDTTNTQHNTSNTAAEIRYAESSMRNGFGLKLLHKFLNVPYLMLQRETLLTQLALNQREIEGTQLELDLYLESDDANYEVFLDGVTRKRRIAAESNAPKPTVDIVAGQPSHTIVTKTVDDKTKAKEDSAKKGLEVLEAIQRKQEAERQEKEKKSAPSTIQTSKSNQASPATSSTSQQKQAYNEQKEINIRSNKKASPGKESLKSAQSIGTGSVHSQMSSKHTNDGVDVDNFVPSVGDDGSIGGIDNFLDGDIMQQDNIQKGNKDATAMASNNYDDSSGDEVVGNPMVAKVMDDDSDIELDDVVNFIPQKLPFDNKHDNKGGIPSLHDAYSSSDNEQEAAIKSRKGVGNDNTSLHIANPLVKKLSDVSISGSSEKSNSSQLSNKNSKKKFSSERKDDIRSNENNFLFDLNALPSASGNNSINVNLEDSVHSSDEEKTKKHKSKKHKKDKKERKGGSKKTSRKVKSEQDDLEEFLNGTISNRDEQPAVGKDNSFAAPEGYDEL